MKLNLANIFNAVDEEVKTVQCKKESKKGCNGKSSKCITHNLWDELEIHINYFFEKKNLKDLIKDNTLRKKKLIWTTRQKEIDNLKDYKYGFSTDIESTRAPKGLNEECN